MASLIRFILSEIRLSYDLFREQVDKEPLREGCSPLTSGGDTPRETGIMRPAEMQAEGCKRPV